jgi:hypothetical protein
MCLFQLPGSTLATIISIYLPLRDIGSFDSATGDPKSREILLGLFATHEFVIEGHRDFVESFSKIGLSDAINRYDSWTFKESFLPWIFKRQISIRKLKTYKIVLPIGISRTNKILLNLHSLHMKSQYLLGIDKVEWFPNLQSFTIDECHNLKKGHLPYLFHLTKLRSLKLSQSTKLDDGFIDRLSRGFSLLEHLDLSYFTKITIKTLYNLAKNCTQLKSLHLTHCFKTLGLTDLQPATLRFPMLTDLNLGYNHLNDQWLLHDDFPSLTYLNLDECVGLTDHSLKHLSKSCPKLKILHLERFIFRDDGLINISQCPELEELCLDSCLHKHNHLIDLYPRWKNLTTLSLNNKYFKSRADLHYNDFFVTDESLKVLSDNCTLLTSLDLSGCNRITDQGLEYLEKFTMLRELNLFSCKQITGNGLLGIGLSCSNLESLSLHDCDIQDGDLDYLVHWFDGNCRTLQFLDLTGSYVSSEGISALSTRCTQLRSLNLSYSPNIDDECLKCLSEHCSMLEYLYLNTRLDPRMEFQQNTITDEGIKHLSEGCQQLKSLELQGCNITLRSLKNLSRGCRLLQYLDISYCEKIEMRDDYRKRDYFKNSNIIKIECRE